MAQDSQGLTGVWQLLRETRQQALAPLLISHGVRTTSDLASVAPALLADGVAPWKVELLTSARDREHTEPRGRWDVPLVRHQKRASLQAALDAALPNNRARCLTALERDILASTTQPSMDSKVKTYVAVCQAWQVRPWPVTLESVQCFGASLKEGAYKSSQGFFQAIFTYQRRHHQTEVDSIIKGAARDYVRSISRGLGPSTLKDSFNVDGLADIPINYEIEPFTMESTTHGRDLLVVACWYMMRELEVASCKWSHIYTEGPTINLLLPVQKNDTSGSLTIRSLRCACRVRLHPLCPLHSAKRHLERVRAHAQFRSQADFPLVPTEDGTIPSKYYMTQFFRQTIAATGTPTTRPNAEGTQTERFSGHVLRVSGAQWLSRLGMESQQVQLLGRWSSAAVEKYLQMAPLLQVEVRGPALLHDDRGSAVDLRQADLVQDPPRVQEGRADNVPEEQEDVQDLRREEAEGDGRVAIEDLREQVASLKQVVLEPQQVLIHRAKSHIVHVGSVSESANAPVHWRSRCGWAYGMTNFYRLQSLQTGFRGCRKCFRDCETPLASESEDSSDSSAAAESSSSSE